MSMFASAAVRPDLLMRGKIVRPWICFDVREGRNHISDRWPVGRANRSSVNRLPRIFLSLSYHSNVLHCYTMVKINLNDNLLI